MRVRIPLLVTLAGLILISATIGIGLQARRASFLRASAAHMSRYLKDVAARLEAPNADTNRALGDFIAEVRNSDRPFELAALMNADGLIVRAFPESLAGSRLSEVTGSAVTRRLLGARDSLPITLQAPRQRGVSATLLRAGPWRGDRLVMIENLAPRVRAAQLDELGQARPLLAIGLLMVAALALLMDRWLRVPAKRIEQTANRIAGGDYAARAQLTGSSELDLVGRALDHMADEIEGARGELLASRRTTETVLDSLPFAIIVTDRDSGRVLFMNARWREATTLSVQIGDRLSDQMANERLVHIDGTPYRYEELATPIALRTGKPAIVSDIVTVFPDGRRKHESAHAMPISLHGIRDFDAVLAVVQDRQEIMALAGELRAGEQRFQRVVEATGQVVYEWDFGAATVRRSNNQENVLGFSAEDELATDARANWEGLLHPDDRAGVLAALDECLRTGHPFDVEYRFRRGLSRWITIHDRGFCDQSPEGVVLRMAGTMSDVTAARETEAQLRQAQKMETVGTLAGGIAHDFNNQLTGIIGHLDLLERELGVHDERSGHARIARAAAERCADLTRGLLAFSRRLDSHPSPASLNTAVRESVQLLRRALPSSIEFQIQLEESLQPVNIDIPQIEQVIFNLCINARDAMSGGGLLRLSTESVTVAAGDPGHPEAYPGTFSRLTVHDSGAGIPDHILGRIFEPFFTTKPVGEGTGLGLSMVCGIVSTHRGWIEVETGPGKGTAFHIYLPTTDLVAKGVIEKQAPAASRSSGELVLVVDDEQLLRELAARALAESGFRVLVAEGGTQALKLAGEHAASLRAVLLDMTMPGMTGAQLLPMLLAIAPQARVVVSSGYSGEGASDLPGAAAFLPKPYALSELVAAIRTALGTPAGPTT